ncbi:Nitrate/nitrite transporter NarK [Pasteurella testudinis DSM 23072]|uniref:Nitrate/nitrite transporter NarK n=1 Tax=Pasteurella testudinis DSM 23072 TaxID=1122938 RepID=A0A1W1UCT5_9PAST|nr:MFS transporter [Pasteurella testudinis]SMB78906.1 Nitrate/nitrite transporter NarK [Pasteurella testudinis DSM 23072]SUB52465.1 Inner membrane transport protein RhmT [Pasteurella testudinis]
MTTRNILQIEQSAVRKVTWRLLPFLFICFFISILDRVNISFAALQMNADLGFSNAVFGIGAGIFFFGYFLLEVPGSAMMAKVGARKWICRIMVSWGILAILMAFIEAPWQFYTIRFLLGVAEASFYPCMVHYLSGFYQTKHHARAIAAFMLAIPGANALGSPLSTFLLTIEGWGLNGWQWMFIIEAIPAVILGVICYFYLTDSIDKAHWLEKEEKEWLIETLDIEQKMKQEVKHYTFMEALKDKTVLCLSAGYFFWMMGYYGINMFLPTISKTISATSGISLQNLGWIIGALYFVSMIVMMLVGNHSDKTQERPWHVAGCLAVSALGLMLATYVADINVWLAFVFLAVALCGAFGAFPPFWAIPPSFITGAAAGGAIALINSIGNLGGFFGPTIVGYLKELTNSFNTAIAFLGVSMFVSAAIIVLSARKKQKELA